MCNTSNIPSVSLQTAVLMQVQEFVNSGQEFSRYDITKALRQKCNDGLLEIPEVEDVNGGNVRYDIRKDAVDNIFEQLWNNGLPNGLPPLTCQYNRVLGYRVFSADMSAASAVPTPTSTPSAIPVLTQTPSVSLQATAPTVTAIPPSRPSNMVTLSDTEIRRRVQLYMKRCSTLGVTPSLKQIQSAIKRGNQSTGLSYREIANVTMSLGWIV